MKPLVYWRRVGNEWRLYVSKLQYVATVWDNGTWHTWDRLGTGGENAAEETVERAKVEAAASAIAQGFI